MNEGELPCRAGRMEMQYRASLRFVPLGIRSVSDEIFLQSGTGLATATLSYLASFGRTKEGRRQAFSYAPPAITRRRKMPPHGAGSCLEMVLYEDVKIVRINVKRATPPESARGMPRTEAVTSAFPPKKTRVHPR